MLSALSMGVLAATARVALTPHEPGSGVAVVFAPWTSAGSALARATQAGATLLAASPSPFVALVMPDDQTYAVRMLDAGAWLVVDLRMVTACWSAWGRR